MGQPTARSQAIKVTLSDRVGEIRETSAVLGIPEWWPTGSRTAAVIAHDAGGDLDDPLIQHLQEGLTQQRFLTLRFNFPFAEAGLREAPDSMAVLERCYRAAISTLAHDPMATPARLLLGGIGLGAKVAARVASDRAGVDATFFVGFPLHPPGDSDAIQADLLYRITCPMLFIQGTRDPRCDLNALRRTLRLVGAPITLRVFEEADYRFRVPENSLRTDQQLHVEVLESMLHWIGGLAGQR